MLEALDENGVSVRIPMENLPSITLYGMSMACIVELYRQYYIRNGEQPVTVKSIKEAFGR